MRILAIIPARKGSKGIKNKNIADLNGRPLIYYTIQTALGVNIFDRVLVSTDSLEIKEICESYGCEIPFLRPDSLGQDKTKTIDVVIDVLKKLELHKGETYDYVCLLQPTSPFRTEADILGCISLLQKHKSGSVVTLSEIDEPHPYKMKVIKDNTVIPLIKESDSSVPRQELPKVYGLNGAIYLTDVDTIVNQRSFFHRITLPYLIPKERYINIDSAKDLLLANALLKSSS